MSLVRLAALAALSFVSLTQAAFAGVPVQVPEPTSLAILGAGVAGVVIAKMRKRK
jgi:hypothetical protein